MSLEDRVANHYLNENRTLLILEFLDNEIVGGLIRNEPTIVFALTELVAELLKDERYSDQYKLADLPCVEVRPGGTEVTVEVRKK